MAAINVLAGALTQHMSSSAKKGGDHLPGPSKIWLANPRLLQTITPTGAYFQTESIADRDCCDRFSSLDIVDHEVLP
jgi:hypothetical protein